MDNPKKEGGRSPIPFSTLSMLTF
uniref:Uncharacterized protein n=1 Tax=Arundo donax TaxID=35708 RepID=A0A0A9AH07_ARUDO